MHFIHSHPLLKFLRSLKGNPKTLIYVEPLWGIPYNLLAPFVTLYMYAQGINDMRIGLIVSIATVVKVGFAFMGGIIADKLGRKTTAVLCDFLGWSLACVLWALSSNFWWFLAATLMNSFEQVNQTAWQCLLIEDAKENDAVNIYTWIAIAGLLSVFFAPLSGLFMNRFSLIPVVRTIYAVFAFTMLVKTCITYRCTVETGQGMIRKAQVKDAPLSVMLKEYKGILHLLYRDSDMLRILSVSALLGISGIVTSTFFGLYANQDLAIEAGNLALFPMLRAVVMLLFLFGLARPLERFGSKKTMMVGIVLYFLSLVWLIFCPPGRMWPVILYTLLEAAAVSLVLPRKDSMLVMGIDKHERARLLAVVVTVSFALSSPFGYLSGLMSTVNRRLPFIFAACIYALCIIIMVRYGRGGKRAVNGSSIP